MSWSLFWSKNSCDHGKGYHFKSHIHPIVNTYWTVSRRQALMLLWHNFLLIAGQHALDSSLILLRLNVWQQAAGCKCKQSPRQSAAMQQATDVGLPLSLLSYCLKITQQWKSYFWVIFCGCPLGRYIGRSQNQIGRYIGQYIGRSQNGQMDKI